MLKYENSIKKIKKYQISKYQKCCILLKLLSKLNEFTFNHTKNLNNVILNNIIIHYYLHVSTF